jgi:hypothetical protein
MSDVAEDITHSVGVHSRRQVGTYRARIVDRAGRLMRPTVVFEAPDDATAIARARALADTTPISKSGTVPGGSI